MSFSRNFSMLFDIFFLRFDLEWWGTIETNVRNISDLFIKWLLILHALRNLEPLMEWEALDYSLSSAFPVYYHDTVDSRALLVIRWIVCYQFWQSLLLCVKRTRAILLHTSECGTLWKDLNMKKDYEREARREREKDKREALCPPTLLYYQNIAWDEWVILPTSALYTTSHGGYEKQNCLIWIFITKTFIVVDERSEETTLYSGANHPPPTIS